MIVRVKEGLGPFKFSGRGLVLRSGDNLVNPDKKLTLLLRRGAMLGKWDIDPVDEVTEPELSDTDENASEKPKRKKR